MGFRFSWVFQFNFFPSFRDTSGLGRFPVWGIAAVGGSPAAQQPASSLPAALEGHASGAAELADPGRVPVGLLAVKHVQPQVALGEHAVEHFHGLEPAPVAVVSQNGGVDEPELVDNLQDEPLVVGNAQVEDLEVAFPRNLNKLQIAVEHRQRVDRRFNVLESDVQAQVVVEVVQHVVDRQQPAVDELGGVAELDNPHGQLVVEVLDLAGVPVVDGERVDADLLADAHELASELVVGDQLVVVLLDEPQQNRFELRELCAELLCFLLVQRVSQLAELPDLVVVKPRQPQFLHLVLFCYYLVLPNFLVKQTIILSTNCTSARIALVSSSVLRPQVVFNRK